jgi:hypothetical protein
MEATVHALVSSDALTRLVVGGLVSAGLVPVETERP